MATDMYIQRGWQPPQRRSFGPLVITVAVIAVVLIGGLFAWRAWRKGEATSTPGSADAGSLNVPPSVPSAPAAPPPTARPAVPANPGPAAPRATNAAPAAARPAPAPAQAPAPSAPAPRAAVPTPPAAGPSGPDPASPRLDAARRLQESGDLAGARTQLMAALDAATTPAVRRQIEDVLGAVNIALVFAPLPMPEKIDYTVQRGDVLAIIARKNHTTVELLQKGNDLKGSMIRPGDRLRILTGTFSIFVDKSDNELVLSLNKRFFKRYRVGTGKFMKTPTGTFKITDRIAQPPWWRDGQPVPYGHPDNVLGTHWLALDAKGYGIHGTWQPESIGKHESAGCIRLLNCDIEELFNLLTIGTEVVIQD